MWRGAAGDPDPCGTVGGDQMSDLRTGHTRADHEHVLSSVGSRILIGGGVDQLAAEALSSRPLGRIWVVIEAGRDHDRGGLECLAAGLDPPAGVGASDPPNLGAEAQIEPVVGSVVLQVLDPPVARGELAVAPNLGSQA